MPLFVETKGRVGVFTVVKEEIFEDPVTKRKTTRPALKLRTMWGEGKPGFLSTSHLSPPEQNQARVIWGSDWQGKLDEEVRQIGKSNGLVEVEETDEAQKLFSEAQSPVEVQMTGARGLGPKHKVAVAPTPVTLVQAAPKAEGGKAGK